MRKHVVRPKWLSVGGRSNFSKECGDEVLNKYVAEIEPAELQAYEKRSKTDGLGGTVGSRIGFWFEHNNTQKA